MTKMASEDNDTNDQQSVLRNVRGHQQSGLSSSQSFNLHGQSSSFRNKNTDIFGSLASLERNYNTNLVDRFSTSDDPAGTKDLENIDDCIDEGSREKFKRPEFPVSRKRGEKRTLGFDVDVAKFGRSNQRYGGRGCRRRGMGFAPDFKVNPEKWTKYTLEDTELAGNSMNSRIALGIVGELRKRREGQDEIEEKADLEAKIVFSKPDTSKSCDGGDKPKVKVHGNVRKIEEYDFAKKEVKPRRVVSQATKELHVDSDAVSLKHLEDSTEDVSDEKLGDKLAGSSREEDTNEVIDTVGASGHDGNEGSSFKSLKKGKSKRQFRGRRDEEGD